MQITLEIPDGDTQRAKLLELLSKENDMVLSQAFLYAQDLCRYGVDVAEKWSTVTKQHAALHRAYTAGFIEAQKKNAAQSLMILIKKFLDKVLTNSYNYHIITMYQSIHSIQ